MKKLAVPAALIFALTACSVHETPTVDDPPPVNIEGDVAPDAGLAIDGAVIADAAPADGSYIRPCDYIEQQDQTNDYEQTPGAYESTSWGLGPDSGAVLCGNINAGHYDAAFRSIDVDRFTFEVFPAATVTVKFSGDADYIFSRLLGNGDGKVGVFIRDYDTGTVYMGGYLSANEATFTAVLPSGPYGTVYDLDVEAYDTQEDIFLSIPYAIEIVGS